MASDVPLSTRPPHHEMLTQSIGSICTVDDDALFDGSSSTYLTKLLQARGVLLFRDLYVDDRQLSTLATNFGSIVNARDGAIVKVSLDVNVSKAAEYFQSSLFWHLDGACEGVPHFASALSPKHLPPTGGQTEFANTYAAWDELPKEKSFLEGLQVVHSFEAAQRLVYPDPEQSQVQAWRLVPPRVQPLVWRHRSGRKSLVLGATASHIEGMPIEQGRSILDSLIDWTTSPRFVYRHEWRLGDVLVWDNTGTIHRALPYDPSLRLMHRVSVAGTEGLQSLH